MFTCNTCNLQFPESNDQRTHMKSEWHRYNLKRKVAQLPPINEELFNSKVTRLQTPDDGEKVKQITKKEQRRKEKEAILEKKKAILEQAKRAMMAERRANQASGEALEDEKFTETIDDSEEAPEQKKETENVDLTQEAEEEIQLEQKLANKLDIPPTTCLFAHPKYHHEFQTVDENVDHMFKQHGLYIPEPNYLIDKTGLIEYLAEKIGFGFCIACNYQGRNAEAAREHMQTKRHMRIPYESEDEKLEISKFYDFSSTYDDDDKKIIVDGADEAEESEGDWEDVSDENEESDSDEELSAADQDAIYQNGNELILPSGAVVGHRSNRRYYRQNLAPERILSEGQGTVIAAETRHMLTLQDRKELAEKKRKWRSEKKREDVNDRRAAKFINNQPHFRDQLLQ
ncbi:REI1 [Candida pseudojiufengensis]|uniref:REI1 n=1 Tax=Candida pseudojiufengensis TaxID=497109 RepID=UPI0022258D0D|nr:REI1 [Candida pseudojiufengensis]KAI5966292.1 REI1 [Candida pseudojiufengensis]